MIICMMLQSRLYGPGCKIHNYLVSFLFLNMSITFPCHLVTPLKPPLLYPLKINNNLIKSLYTLIFITFTFYTCILTITCFRRLVLIVGYRRDLKCLVSSVSFLCFKVSEIIWHFFADRVNLSGHATHTHTTPQELHIPTDFIMLLTTSKYTNARLEKLCFRC